MTKLLLLLFISSNTWALNLQKETANVADFFHDINDIAETENLEASDFLIVIDIDNTLLAMTENFGSDQWYKWKSQSIDGV